MAQGEWGSRLARTAQTARAGQHALRARLSRLLLAAAAVLLAAAPAHALPPIFVSAPSSNATQGVPYAYRVQAIDLDFGDRVVYAAPQVPSWLVFDGVDVIAGTPGPGDVGTHTVALTASDGQTVVTQTFDIVVANVDDPPQLVGPITPDPQAINERASYTFDVAPFFSDPDGDALTFTQSGLPPELVIDAATGRITGEARFPSDGQAPEYTVTITASNAGGAASDSFVLIINNENDAPVIPEPVPPLKTAEDTPLDLTPDMLRARDPDPGDSLTVLVQTPPGDASYTVSGARVVPAGNFNGTLELKVQVRDAAGAVSNVATATLEVEARNDAPRARAIPAQTADEGSAFTFDASPYFSDVENDRLTYRASGLPPGLAIDPSSGVISGTPPIGTEARTYDVQIVASDGTAEGTGTLKTTVVRARRADLVAVASVAPSPSMLSNEATWTLAVRNASEADVGNAVLTAVFFGDVPLTFGTPNRPECSIRPGATETTLECRFAALAANSSAEVKVGATASRAGAAYAAVDVKIADPLPIESNSGNNQASATLGISERLSAGPAQRLTLQDARGAAAGDLDGDGFEELVVATAGGPVAFRNVVDPDNTHKRLLADVPTPLAGDSTNGYAIALGDLDGDGDVDAVTANIGQQSNKVLLNDGTGQFTATALPNTDAASRSVALGDIDGDTRLDIAFASQGNGSIHVNRGDSFTHAQTVGEGDARDVVLANLIGDSLPELVLAYADRNAAVYRNTNGRFALEVELPTGPTTSVAAADFDRDGDVDLVFGRAATMDAPPAAVVFLNTSAGSGAFFESAVLLGAALDVLVDDFNGDGAADIAAFGADGGHRLHVNDGAARFTLHPEQFVHAGAAGAAAGKLSVDGRIDIAVAGSTAVGVFFNDGRSNFGGGDRVAPTVSLRGEPSVSLTVGASYQDPGATASDDVDGDLTASIMVDNPVNTAVVGTYAVTYAVSDSSGNGSTATRTVEVTPQEGKGGGGGGALGAELALVLSAFVLIRRTSICGVTKCKLQSD